MAAVEVFPSSQLKTSFYTSTWALLIHPRRSTLPIGVIEQLLATVFTWLSSGFYKARSMLSLKDNSPISKRGLITSGLMTIRAAGRPSSHRRAPGVSIAVRKIERLGTLQNGEIRNDTGVVLARYAGKFRSFHIYNASVLFAGIVNELICQMPEAFRKSDKPYFYTISKSEKIVERYEVHLATIELYEEVEK